MTSGSARSRLSRPDLFMNIARLHGERSSCIRAKVGVTATRDDRVIASGYVGAPHGMPHCLDVGCDIERGHCVRSTHAEANLIAWCARVGAPLHGTTLWCTHAPCYTCAKLIANLDIIQLVYLHKYSDDRGVDLLMNLDVPVVPFKLIKAHLAS